MDEQYTEGSKEAKLEEIQKKIDELIEEEKGIKSGAVQQKSNDGEVSSIIGLRQVFQRS